MNAWQSVLVFVFAGYGLGMAAMQAWVIGKLWLKRWRMRSAAKRSEALKAYLGKLIRHTKTGRVGLCLGVGAFNTLRGELAVEVCFCTECAKAMCDAKSAGDVAAAFAHSVIARQSGHTAGLPAKEITLAPAADAEAFREAMNNPKPSDE